MAADVSVDLEEAHFSFLPSQPNIYSMAKIDPLPEESKVLVASLNGRVTCVEYENESGGLFSREIPFTYIPAGDAEIVSIDAFVRSSSDYSQGLVIGISLILLNVQNNSGNNQKQFLNIYSSVEKDKEVCLDNIAEGCQLIELDFVPFQLCHTQIKSKRSVRETVFLLAGSDCTVHMFMEDNTHQSFEEYQTEDIFPEFQDLQSNVIWMDIKCLPLDQRLTAIGCQSGHVQVALVDTAEDPKILQLFHVDHDGPITAVNVFPWQHDDLNTSSPDMSVDKPSPEYHLLVCCATEPCVIYTNIISQGLSQIVVLPDSDKFDCVLCTCMADVDWDGNKELLLGTYGQELLVYKFGSTSTGQSTILDLKLMWRRSFSSPLYAIQYLDMTGDGLREVVVASLLGVHILQHKLDKAASLCYSKIKKLQESDHCHQVPDREDLAPDP
ncbi:KICSTOR complex protein kaptin isoform X2 [Nematostella vectensis]|uniref:KICSTOR complex protein kaptin isoform X2 n=1 Tax=Nematostella vectensis TaxID=45351 RepID=UPI0020773A62|nr:KICSTOR complex protein kaptin isoform X2 [Nematostella vectensis]